MDIDQLNLLARLRHPGDQEAWERFVQLYTPLMFYWARKLGLSGEEAADLVQEVFLLLVQKLPGFVPDPERSFRGWLRTVLHNKWRELGRRRAIPVQPGGSWALGDVEGGPRADELDEAEYRAHLVGRALRIMESEFQPTTWKACWEAVVSARPAADVAAELGISVASVYAAKSRVLRRLRQELEGLLD